MTTLKDALTLRPGELIRTPTGRRQRVYAPTEWVGWGQVVVHTDGADIALELGCLIEVEET